MKAIETRYAGCRFRSRLEAKWCVFFQQLDLRWQYEPQGFRVNGRPYLPDFYLPESRTWVEVKGHEDFLDHNLMEAFASELPFGQGLLLLGDIPDPKEPGDWDWGWLHLAPEDIDGQVAVFGSWVGFGPGQPTVLTETSCATPFDSGYCEGWLEPTKNMAGPDASAAYAAAKSARFEHGESGAGR